jgi:hypothetical protein
MPTIIVLSNENADRDSAVMLSENVQPEHLASNHHRAQLIERVGWAVTDAKELENAWPRPTWVSGEDVAEESVR